MPAASVSVQMQTESSFCWNNSSTTRRYFGKTAALFGAEAAADDAIQKLRQETIPLWLPDGITNNPGFWYQLPVAGEYVVRRSEFRDDFPDPDLREFVARGRNGDVETALTITIRRRPQAVGNGYAGILGTQQIHVFDRTQAQFDAYDSSAGPYTPANRISVDVLRTNSSSPEKITIPRSGADVWGRIAVGPGLTDQDQVNQVVKNRSEIRWYAGGPEPYSPPSAFSAPSVPAPSPDTCTDSFLNLTGSQRVTLDSGHNGGSYHFCNAGNQTAVSLADSSRLVATGGGLIVVYVDGDLAIADHASITSSAGETSVYFVVNRHFDVETAGTLALRNSANDEDPSKLRFYVAGTGRPVRLTAPSGQGTLQLYGLVYAPERHLQVDGSGQVEIFGGLLGTSIHVDVSEFDLHADLALQHPSGQAMHEADIEIVSWRRSP